MSLQVEFDFTLPKGYVDADGSLHRHGVMRLATARDEIEPLRDPRIVGPDDPYLTLVILSRVVVSLGSTPVTAQVVENLFAADLAYLQDLYGIINFGDPEEVEALRSAMAAEQGLDSEGSASEPELEDEPEVDETAASDPGPPRVRARVEEVAGSNQP